MLGFTKGDYRERLGGRHRPDVFIIDIFCTDCQQADCQQHVETGHFPTGSIETAIRTGQGELGDKRGYCDGICQRAALGKDGYSSVSQSVESTAADLYRMGVRRREIPARKSFASK